MANRTIEELERAYLSLESAREFDSRVERFRKRQRVIRTLSVAASLVLIFTIARIGRTVDSERTIQEISTVELLETIAALTENNLNEIDSINAKPGKRGVIITADFKDGERKTYLMKRAADGSSIEMTAQNSK